MKKFFLFLILLILPLQLQAQSDDIPNNCPYQRGIFFNNTLFPRYEFNNQRVVLVNWSTGADVRELGTGISGGEYRVMGWSPECQYLSIAFSHLDDQNVQLWDTYVWDVVAGGQIAYFPDARLSPFPMTWDTNSTQMLIETRFGAYLWKLDGGQVWLTSEADYNSRSFRQGTVQWDYATNQVRGVLSIPPNGTAIYYMSSGALVAISNQFNEALDIANTNLADVQASENGERYPCQRQRYYGDALDGLRLLFEPTQNGLVLRDAGTRDVVRVVDAHLADDIGNLEMRGITYYLDCRFLRVTFGRIGMITALYDLNNDQRMLLIDDAIIRQFSLDPSGTYAVITTRNGTNLHHLASGRINPLIPNVSTSSYGSGAVWSFSTIDWDLANQQVRLGISPYNWYGYRRVTQTQIFDLQSGLLVSVVDDEGQPLSQDDLNYYETRQVAPYGCRWSVEYQTYNQRIVLEDQVTRDLIVVVEDNFSTDNFRYLGGSPDCRYIAAAIGEADHYDTYIWDLAEGRRVGVFADAQYVPHQLNWAPFGGLVIVHTRDGGFLWNLTNDSRLQLNTGAFNNNTSSWSEASVTSFYQIEWDMAAGEVLTVPVDQPDRAVAYDLAKGQVRAEYPLEAQANPVNFIQNDDQRLIVFTAYNARSPIHRENGLALWNRATGNGIQFAMDYYVVPYQYASTSDYRSYPQFSPDGSLMLMRSGNYVYIWDLNTLSGDSPNLPTYVHELEITSDAYFVDSTTIRTCHNTTSEYQRARRITEYTSTEYDVVTGSLLQETSETRGYNYFTWSAPLCSSS